MRDVPRLNESFSNPANAALSHSLTLLSSADTLVNTGRLDEAKALYSDVLQLDPANLRAMLALGRVERRRGNELAACQWLESAVSIDSFNVRALLDLAEVLRDLGRSEEAAAIYRKILAADAHHSQSHMGLGWISRADRDEETARAHFRMAERPLAEAVERDPANHNLAQLAAVWRELGRMDEASAVYQRILARDAMHVQSLMGLGWIARASGNNEEALSHFKAAAEVDPNEPQPRMILAKVFALLHRLDDAEEIYRAVLERAPGHWRARAALGAVARAKHDWPSALEYLNAAVASNPRNIHCRIELARTLCELLRWDDAEKVYRDVLVDSHRNIDALIGLAETAKAKGDRREALARFEYAATLAPLDIRPKQEIGRILAAEGGFDWKDELENALSAARSPSAPVETQIEAAKILVEYGLTEDARPVLCRLEGISQAARQLIQAVRQIERMGLSQHRSKASESPDPNENRLEVLQGFLDVPAPDARTLLLVFGGTNNRLSITFSLLHKILRKTGVSIVYCRDLQQQWYSKGIVGLGHDYESTVDGFLRLAGRSGTNRILTLGNCVGCRGALRFGLSLGAEGVLGLAPKINPGLGLNPYHKKQLAAIREHLGPSHRNVRSVYLQAAVRPAATLVFGEHDTVDPAEAQTMADVPGVEITIIPDSADPVKDLLVRGLLEPLLREFVEHGSVSPELRMRISTPAAQSAALVE